MAAQPCMESIPIKKKKKNMKPIFYNKKIILLIQNWMGKGANVLNDINFKLHISRRANTFEVRVTCTKECLRHQEVNHEDQWNTKF